MAQSNNNYVLKIKRTAKREQQCRKNWMPVVSAPANQKKLISAIFLYTSIGVYVLLLLPSHKIFLLKYKCILFAFIFVKLIISQKKVKYKIKNIVII